MAMAFGKIFMIFSLFLLIASFGCVKTDNPPVILSKPIPKFSTCSQIKAAFEENRNSSRGSIYDMAFGITSMGTTAKGTSSSNEAVSNPAYSSTNIQVEGVDEADIVKTDGKYIYLVSKNNLVIAEAYPESEAKILSKLDLNGITPTEIFTEGNKVLVFGQEYFYYQGDYAETVSNSKMMPQYYPYNRNFSTTVLQLIDVSNKQDPKIERRIEFEGSYLSSRKIGSNAFFVINAFPQYYAMESNDSNEEIVPLYKDSTTSQDFKPISRCANIGYLEPIAAESFVTIGSISMADATAPIQKETIVGSGQNVYASIENLYLAQTSYNYGNVIKPMAVVPAPIPVAIAIPNPSENFEETAIQKFSLKDGKISYLGAMKAPGTILNQFSMDEFEGNFRIATTKGHISRGGGNSTNNIYIFNNNLDMVGKLEELAPGEKIYSARFMGKKAYLVTFKKVDPLFVIDLSVPESPKVLGKLKIPGYSDYLHPIDENHLIGLGKDTVEGDELGNFAWYQGIKIAIFDVSDVENPKEMFKTVVGDRGTDSYALQDHKAFLYDKEKNLLVLPITLAEIKNKEENMPGSTYGDFVWQGAYVWNLTLEKGFELKGKINHNENNDSFLKSGYYYYGANTDIKRTLFIDNVLYTISDAKIQLNSLDNLEKLKELPIEISSNETQG